MVDGYKFDSILESQVYEMLKNDPMIKILELQPNVKLTEASILYRPDFKCIKQGVIYYVEAKGYETPMWKLKKRLWAVYGPASLEIYAKQSGKIVLKEFMNPIQN